MLLWACYDAVAEWAAGEDSVDDGDDTLRLRDCNLAADLIAKLAHGELVRLEVTETWFDPDGMEDSASAAVCLTRQEARRLYEWLGVKLGA